MEPLKTIGLGGDGDEVIAVEAAFKAVGMKLPAEDAPRWFTVGDVWKSAVKHNPSLSDDQKAWDNFRRELSADTDVDWTRVSEETELLSSGLIERLREWWASRT